MFQQLLANKHHRLHDAVPIMIWPSGGLGLVTDKKKKTKKVMNPVQSKNRTWPMAARLKIATVYQLLPSLQLPVLDIVHANFSLKFKVKFL